MRETFDKLRSDISEKRLLPLVVLLVVGLIAIPVLAGKKRSSATAETLPPTTTVVAVPAPKAKPKSSQRSSSGLRDPFDGGPAATAATSTTTSTTPSTTTTTPSTSTSSAATTATTPRTTGSLAGSRSGRSGPRRYTIKSVDLRFGTATKPPVQRNVARLSLFPSAKHPIAIVLGPLYGSSRQAVVFQLVDQVSISGKGVCVPRVSLCTQVVLRPGDHVLLTRSNGKRYRLQVAAVRKSSTTSKRRAAHAYDRVSKAGQCLLDTYAAFGFTDDGTVTRRGDGKGCRYSGMDAPKVLGASK